MPQTASLQRTCIFVLGMHRSGTSALTRVISLLGAALPKTLMPASDENEAGYWEPVLITELNDRILAEAGTAWDDWRPFDIGALALDRLEQHRREIKRLIADEYGDAPLFVLKDPRISRMVPLYAGILAELGITPLYAISYRNPLGVISSLAARGTTRGFAGLIWLRYVIDVEAATRGARRAFVSFDRLLEDWRGCIADMTSSLGIDWPISPVAAAAEIEAHLQPGQRHHKPTDRDLDDDTQLSSSVAAAHKAVSGGHGDLATLEAIRARLDGVDADITSATFEELAARSGRITALIAEAEAEHVVLKQHEAEASRLRAELHVATTQLTGMIAHLAKLDAELQTLTENYQRERLTVIKPIYRRLRRGTGVVLRAVLPAEAVSRIRALLPGSRNRN